VSFLPLSIGVSFRYDEPEWMAIRGAIAHLPNFGRAITETGRERFGPEATLTEVMRHWLESAASQYLSERDSRPASLKMRTLLCEKILREIDQLRDSVVEFAQAAFGGQRLQADIGADLEDAFESLSGMRDFFSDLGSVLGPDSVMHFGCSFAPFTPPRATYFRGVLDVWLHLGGELKISRHPVSGDVRGPLWRYFAAAIEPVTGADAISAASFPGLVADYRKLKAAAQMPAPVNEPAA